MKPRLESLDRLRGAAVMLMVVNHLGVALYGGEPARATPAGAAVFLGSFAPVLFFFVTGYGAGLRRGPGKPASVAAKASLLLLADWLLLRRAGHWVGLDFLGFIALAMIALEALRSLRHADAVALALLLVAPLGRFLLAPIALSGAGSEPVLAELVLGVRPLDGVAYPPLPWAAFPLAGFLAARWDLGSASLKAPALAATSLVLALAAAWLVAGGRPLFRWGTVSVAFFLASGAVLAASAWAVDVSRSSTALRPFAVSGIASLAAVPLHYLGIDLLLGLGVALPTGATFGVLVVLLTAFCLATGRALETAWLALRPRDDLFRWMLPASLALLLGWWIEPAALLGTILMAMGQLGLCAATAWNAPASVERRPPDAVGQATFATVRTGVP